MPIVEYISGQKAHIFKYTAVKCHCKHRSVRQFLDTGDAKSTGNLCQHTKVCWGKDVVAAADNTQDIKTAWDALGSSKSVDGSITALFYHAAKGQVTYSHHQHTKLEAQ
jgi:hypothetical protein